MRYLLTLVLMVALLTGCARPGSDPPSSDAPSLPSRNPLVTGTITKVEGGRILVEADPTKDEGNKCWFAVQESTLVAAEKDGKIEKADAAALKEGQAVKAWESGPILESYPCQTGGEAILILPETNS